MNNSISNNFVHGLREHVKLGPMISETVKGKLGLGARIFQQGGLRKVFRRLFQVREGEKLFKVCQCYLSTTAGPIAGLPFISNQRVAFCSEKSLTITCTNGDMIKTRYKVLVPLTQIKRATQSANVNKLTEKYIEIVTVDKFEFWFMGFVNYEKAFKYLQHTISQF